jgi:hypothetical protein
VLRKWGAIVMGVALVTGSCMVGYPATDPFAGTPRSDRPGVPTYEVSFEGKCGICSVTLDVAGQRDVFVDTALIRRRHRVVAMPGAHLVMSAVAVEDWGPVEYLEIRVDGDVIAETSERKPDGVEGTGSGAVTVSAVLPQD